ncbi:MAG TPA: nuclear transport factor 2 family protein [Pyrinomonadaceae bacterium]|nr:nuclear transport factor 2 family protein [Pyrinomonadaceae bacterium]
MKYFSLTFLLITLSVSANLANGQTPAKSDATTQAIMQLENSFNEAMLKGDAAGLEKLLANDWFLQMEAALITRDQYADWLKSNGGPYSAIKDNDVNVRLHDSAVVVEGVSARTLKGTDTVKQIRFTRVYAKTASGWQLVAMHFDKLN